MEAKPDDFCLEWMEQTTHDGQRLTARVTCLNRDDFELIGNCRARVDNSEKEKVESEAKL